MKITRHNQSGKLAPTAAPKQITPIPRTPGQKTKAKEQAQSILQCAVACIDEDDDPAALTSKVVADITATRNAFRQFLVTAKACDLQVLITLFSKAEKLGLTTAVETWGSDNVQEEASARKFLDTCRLIKRNSRGFTTPVENLIESLVLAYGLGSVRPDDVRRHMQEFEQDFDLTAEALKKFSAQYPEVVNPAHAENKPAA